MRNGITYDVREEVYCLGEKRRVAFGIVAYAAAEEDGSATVIASVGDVCAQREPVADLAGLCTALRLDPSHLYDVVEDFLYDHKNQM